MPRRGENIYKRKDGRWEGRYNYTHDEYGKRHYCSVYARSYQEIKNRLFALRKEEQPSSSCVLTVKELFYEWLSAVRFKVKESTYFCYKMKVDKHLLPEFGKMNYAKLDVRTIHNFIGSKLRNGLSPKYVSDIIIVFKSMSKYISKTHRCYDPIKDVSLPKRENKKTELLSDTQQQKLKSLSHDKKRTSLAVMLSYYTGLRIGEVCGLK